MAASLPSNFGSGRRSALLSITVVNRHHLCVNFSKDVPIVKETLDAIRAHFPDLKDVNIFFRWSRSK